MTRANTDAQPVANASNSPNRERSGVQFRTGHPSADNTDPPGPPPADRTRPGWLVWLASTVAVAASVHTSLAMSPCWDELGHLSSGIYHWKTSRYDAYMVNPPLFRLWVALPQLVDLPEMPAAENVYGMCGRKEWPLALSLVRGFGGELFGKVALSRLMHLPVMLLGLWVCWRWTFDIAGADSADIATALFALCPVTLSTSSVLTPDYFATVFGLLASYRIWLWVRRPDIPNGLFAGLAVGIALASKFVWILCVPAWIGAAVACAMFAPRSQRRSRRRALGSLLLSMGIAWATVVGTYGFRGMWHPLKSITPCSDMLKSNTFRELQSSALGSLPLPVPIWLIQGVDIQKRDFERGYPCFFAGHHSPTGFPTYYLVVLALKVPLTTLLLLVCAAPGACRRLPGTWMVLLTPTAFLLGLSVNDGFTHHARYAAPALPYVYILIGTGVAAYSVVWRRIAFGTVLLGAAFLGKGYPHLMAYTNELAGTVRERHWLLGSGEYDSTLDWGQNLLFLRTWLQQNPGVKLDGFVHNHFNEVVEAAGLPSNPPPSFLPAGTRAYTLKRAQAMGNDVRWYALTVKGLHDRHGRWQDFNRFEPAAIIGGTIFLYAVDCP